VIVFDNGISVTSSSPDGNLWLDNLYLRQKPGMDGTNVFWVYDVRLWLTDVTVQSDGLPDCKQCAVYIDFAIDTPGTPYQSQVVAQGAISTTPTHNEATCISSMAHGTQQCECQQHLCAAFMCSIYVQLLYADYLALNMTGSWQRS
jgi:hypothetical protein